MPVRATDSERSALQESRMLDGVKDAWVEIVWEPPWGKGNECPNRRSWRVGDVRLDMSDLSDLYSGEPSSTIASGRGILASWPSSTWRALGHNPLCGDRLTLYLKLDGDRVSGVMFEGSGRAISKALGARHNRCDQGQDHRRSARPVHALPGDGDAAARSGDRRRRHGQAGRAWRRAHVSGAGSSARASPGTR